MGVELVVAAPSEMDLLLELDREHRAVEECLTDALTHALRAGEILLGLREQHDGGTWRQWLQQHGPCTTHAANVYMRLARYRDQIPANATIQQARQLLVGAPYANRSGVRRVSPEVKQRALELVADGWLHKDAAQEVGVTASTVSRWVDPERYAAIGAKQSRRIAAARKHDRELAKAAEIKRAVRKAGAATAEAWAMAERFQDVIAQAHDETQDSEARAALARAGEHYRKMRDEIVRALGVS